MNTNEINNLDIYADDLFGDFSATEVEQSSVDIELHTLVLLPNNNSNIKYHIPLFTKNDVHKLGHIPSLHKFVEDIDIKENELFILPTCNKLTNNEFLQDLMTGNNYVQNETPTIEKITKTNLDIATEFDRNKLEKSLIISLLQS